LERSTALSLRAIVEERLQAKHLIAPYQPGNCPPWVTFSAVLIYLVHCGLGFPVSTKALRRNKRLPHMELQPAMNGVMSRTPR